MPAPGLLEGGKEGGMPVPGLLERGEERGTDVGPPWKWREVLRLASSELERRVGVAAPGVIGGEGRTPVPGFLEVERRAAFLCLASRKQGRPI